MSDETELRQLCEAAIEDRLTEEQSRRLEELVRDDPEARRFCARYFHLHACLQWSGTTLPSGGISPGSDVPRHPPGATPHPLAEKDTPVRSRGVAKWSVILALAASLLVGLWVALKPAPVSRPIATLTSARACKWDEGTLPTQTGAELGPGRLRLAEGLARLVFACGAEITLEGPADLELISGDRCILHGGRLMARVPEEAIGFRVETPTALVKDLGTEFGVHVREDRTADVQVFNGRVDVRHRATGKLEVMRTGQGLRFEKNAVSPFDPAAENPPQRRTPPSGRVVHLSTAMGRGKDGYVQKVPHAKHRSDILLLVKNTLPEKADYLRKAYLTIDLAPIKGRQIREAQLTFTFAPTGMGWASEVPDATFTVYGLTDEAADGWDEKNLRWENAPANRAGGTQVDPAKTVKLGTFFIRQGELQGNRRIRGDALVKFLRSDTNGMATFILVRDTPGTGRNDLVHGFANRNHPRLPPPTLQVILDR